MDSPEPAVGKRSESDPVAARGKGGYFWSCSMGTYFSV